ncbi:LysR substrate-binding domain-containing protein [Defluviimonas aestuarii]|uniref:LysR substrate-binding domain-containing protein n=1 Tax=Albidovulum aestuarii TaxID=1130726 RepID=UPI00249BC6F2|nr:LysR substrate-binding domain-containing protein [Defluviimonas aestuarii]MDI3338418.1 LysR substrate-binding domain-containing protein [Defluviimonas aestuarii]
MLPPLNAMRAFEVAARTGSFVQAGVELGVTSAAVSQQVRALEQHLGKHLFLRQGNRITLTDAGRAIYPRIEQALTDLASVADELAEGRNRARLVVSVLPSVAELWLAPAMVGFASDGKVEIRVEDDPVAFARDGVDLRITYGADYYADHVTEVLFRDRIVAVAAPGFTMPEGGVEALPDSAFIHTDWGPAFATQPAWNAWFADRLSDRRPDPGAGLKVGMIAVAAALARAGLGVALVPERIAGDDIRSERLLVVEPHSLPMSRDYVMVWPSAIARRTLLRAVVAHLREAAVRVS